MEPNETGMLDVGDGQRIYWEISGNPSRKPAIALHAGPGVGSSPGRRRSFAPERYRLVQFDQRGCGRSTPSVADPSVGLAHNTTHHLVADIERIREHLGIEKWLVWGASWGTTLALAYAQRFPERVSELVLVSTTLARRSDVRWIYHEAGRFFPEAWARFREGVPEDERDDLVAAYDRLLNRQPDLTIRAQAAARWCAWEDALLSLEEGWRPSPRFEDPAFRMTFARLCAYYFSHAAWLGEDELLGNMGRLAGIPGVLIHGRFDIQCPVDVPYLIARAWPDAELQVVGEGHSGGGSMSARILEALDRFARRSTA